MIYLDYSANTPVDARVLEQFCAVERRCIGNANSHHQAGSAAKAEIDAATIKIASLLGVQPAEIDLYLRCQRGQQLCFKGAGPSLPPCGQAHHLHSAGAFFGQRHPDGITGAGV